MSGHNTMQHTVDCQTDRSDKLQPLFLVYLLWSSWFCFYCIFENLKHLCTRVWSE
ncbi:unnamed protein product [Ectocarpus sp. 12 AP-2014]